MKAKRSFLSLALVLLCALTMALALSAVTALPAAAVTLEGSGTQSDPYLVSTAEELQAAMDSTANDVNYITYVLEPSHEPSHDPMGSITVPVILGREGRPMVLTIEMELAFSGGGVLRIENQATVRGGRISSRETDASVYVNTEEAVLFEDVDFFSSYCESCVVLEHSPNVSFVAGADDGHFEGANTGLVLVDSSATVSGYTLSMDKSIYSLDESSSLTLDGAVKTGPDTHKRPRYVKDGIEIYFANKFGWVGPAVMIPPTSGVYHTTARMTPLEETDADGDTLYYYTVAPEDVGSSGEIYFVDAQGGGTGGKSQKMSLSSGSVYVPGAVGSDTEPCGLTSYPYVVLHEHDDVSFTELPPVSGESTLQLAENAVMTGNITVSGVTVPAGENVSLCLCGHTLDLGTGSLTVETGGTLSIYDCSAGGTGKITSSTATD